MTELHVRIPDDVAQRLAEDAAGRGITPEELAAERIAVAERHRGSGALSFIGIGRAKSGFSARAAEERMEAEGLV